MSESSSAKAAIARVMKPMPSRVSRFMLSLIVGVIWGGVASWLAAGTGRKRARDTVQRASRAESESRDLKNRVARLESEVRDTKASAKTTNTPVGPPALPPANAA